jgi:membrane associated rhomboid family serine protease
MGRSIARLVAILLLVVTGLLGVYNGVIERSDVETPLQASVNAGVLLYGVLGLVGTYGALRRRRWVVWSVTAWAILITYVSGTAALAFAGADAGIVGAVSAAVGAALIGAFVVWAVRPAPPELAAPTVRGTR